MATTKTCSKCKRTMPHSEFRKRKESRDGLRGQCRDCYRGKRKPKTDTAGAPGGGRLPIEPFRKWLTWKLEYYESNMRLLSEATGISERALWRCFNESQTVTLDLVDRALITEGSTPLWALNYSEEDFQKAAIESARTESRRSSESVRANV